jgi:hypothetical protein
MLCDVNRSSSNISAHLIERILARQKPFDCFAGFPCKPEEHFGSDLTASLLVSRELPLTNAQIQRA